VPICKKSLESEEFLIPLAERSIGWRTIAQPPEGVSHFERPARFDRKQTHP
jgi:hypothetical protein